MSPFSTPPGCAFDLIISTSSQLPVIRNAMATISDIRVFLSRSAQRVSIFQDNVEREVSGSASSRQKLKPTCATRWVERHDMTFVTLLPAVVSTLEELQQVATMVATLLNSVQKCTFLIATLVMQRTSGIILPVSEHKTGIDLTVSSTLKKPSKNYTCFISRRFGLFLIHLQSKNKATLDNVSNSKP